MKNKFEFAKAEVISMIRLSAQRTARYENAMYSTTNEDEQEKFNRWRKGSAMEENVLYDVLTLAFGMQDDEVEAIIFNAKRDK